MVLLQKQRKTLYIIIKKHVLIKRCRRTICCGTFLMSPFFDQHCQLAVAIRMFLFSALAGFAQTLASLRESLATFAQSLADNT